MSGYIVRQPGTPAPAADRGDFRAEFPSQTHLPYVRIAVASVVRSADAAAFTAACFIGHHGPINLACTVSAGALVVETPATWPDRQRWASCSPPKSSPSGSRSSALCRSSARPGSSAVLPPHRPHQWPIASRQRSRAASGARSCGSRATGYGPRPACRRVARARAGRDRNRGRDRRVLRAADRTASWGHRQRARGGDSPPGRGDRRARPVR